MSMQHWQCLCTIILIQVSLKPGACKQPICDSLSYKECAKSTACKLVIVPGGKSRIYNSSKYIVENVDDPIETEFERECTGSTCRKAPCECRCVCSPGKSYAAQRSLSSISPKHPRIAVAISLILALLVLGFAIKLQLKHSPCRRRPKFGNSENGSMIDSTYQEMESLVLHEHPDDIDVQ